MSTPTSTHADDIGPDVFDDPVAYLASLGIEAEIIAVTGLPAAA